MRHGRISQRRGKIARESSDARRSAAGFDGAHHHRVQQGASGGCGVAGRIPDAARHVAVGWGGFTDVVLTRAGSAVFSRRFAQVAGFHSRCCGASCLHPNENHHRHF